MKLRADRRPMIAAPPPRATGAGHETTVVPLVAGDGLELNLHHVRGPVAPSRGPVLLVHGAGVRADIFRPPTARTIVDVLVDDGYDVWLLNWRASSDVAATPWTLDAAAVHDHPRAVEAVLDHTGADSLQAIVHCQGSTSFVMAAAAGLVPQVRTIITNAVSLHPVVPAFSRFKLRRVAPLVRRLTDHLDPSWGLHADRAIERAVVAFVRATHRECDNTVCRMVSFTYGTGFPGLWRHENLNQDTHDWLAGQFTACPMSFFAQMDRCVRDGGLVSVDGIDALPARFVEAPPATDARFVFLAGARNRCFLPDSQVRSHRWMLDRRPGRHTLHVFPDYGHLDVFIGQAADRDVFPTILAELHADPA